MRIAATQKLPGPAWDELPDVELLDGWPPRERLPGVEALVAVVVRVGAKELDLLPGTVLVIRGSELLTGDTVVGDDDVLEVRPVMSGGAP